MNLWVGGKPGKRTFEMISYYFMGLASEPVLLAHLLMLRRPTGTCPTLRVGPLEHNAPKTNIDPIDCQSIAVPNTIGTEHDWGGGLFAASSLDEFVIASFSPQKRSVSAESRGDDGQKDPRPLFGVCC